MLRQGLFFVLAVGAGALLILVVRSAWHRPYDAAIHAWSAPTVPQPASVDLKKKPTVEPRAERPATSLVRPVNTVCSLCGMDVDPEIPSVIFNGEAIGFACLKCPPKFKQDPGLFGPYYLRNEKVPKELVP